MREKTGAWSRPTVLTAILASGAFIWIVGAYTVRDTSAQPQQTPSRFMGGNPSPADLGGLNTSKLRFPAGSRSNWHSHPQGQLLMVEEGKARTQERGKPVRELGPGQPWWTSAGVEHWHGAAPDQAILQWTIYAGEVKWLEPVQDKEYLAPAQK